TRPDSGEIKHRIQQQPDPPLPTTMAFCTRPDSGEIKHRIQQKSDPPLHTVWITGNCPGGQILLSSPYQPITSLAAQLL
ncbi:MAG: hypothetical protein WBD56_14925, partial [Anaerolineales bacterium]